MSGRPAGDLRTDPVGWAYALRDAASLAAPDLVVSHLDPGLEADAVQIERGDPVDALLDVEVLAAAPPVSRAVELVGTLAGMPGYSGRVAATVTSPHDLAARLHSAGPAGSDFEELTEVAADLLAGLVEAYAGAGASAIVVALHSPAPRPETLTPLERAGMHARIEVIAWDVAEPTAGDLAIAVVPADTPLADLAGG